MSIALVARDDYEPNEPGHIHFRKGEKIQVVEKHLSGWWRGKNSEGSEGFFPSTYVSRKKKKEGDEEEGLNVEELCEEIGGEEQEQVCISPRSRKEPPPVAARRKSSIKSNKEASPQKKHNSDPSNPKRMSKASRLKRLHGLKDMSSNTIEQRVKSLQKRKRVAEELLSTEKTYVENLTFLVNEYKNPIIKFADETKCITTQAVQTIFSNITLIAQLHEKLYAELQEQMKTWSPEEGRIGNIFLTLVPFMRMYTDYVNNYDSALSMLSHLHKNKRFTTFLQARKTPMDKMKGDWYLTHLLILPVQRIPRYEMLLNDLVKHTSPEHEDYSDLVECSKKIADLAMLINAKKKSFKKLQKMWMIHNKLIYPKSAEGDKLKRARDKRKMMNLVKPSRELVKKGNVITIDKGAGMLYLFNDSLLLAKSLLRGELLEFVSIVNLFNSKVEGTAETRFITVVSNISETVMFYVEDESKYDVWKEAINKEVEKYTQKKANIKELRPFQVACISGDEKRVRAFLELYVTTNGEVDFDPNGVDHKGRTPLHRVAKNGHVAIAKILVEEFGVDIFVRSENGLQAYDYAAAAGHITLAKYLQAKLKEANKLMKTSRSSLLSSSGHHNNSNNTTPATPSPENYDRIKSRLPRSLAATFDALKKSLSEDSFDALTSPRSPRTPDGATTPTTPTTPQSDTPTTTTSGESPAPPPSPGKKKKTRRKKKKRMSRNLSASQSIATNNSSNSNSNSSNKSEDKRQSTLSKFSIKRFATWQIREKKGRTEVTSATFDSNTVHVPSPQAPKKTSILDDTIFTPPPRPPPHYNNNNNNKEQQPQQPPQPQPAIQTRGKRSSTVSNASPTKKLYDNNIWSNNNNNNQNSSSSSSSSRNIPSPGGSPGGSPREGWNKSSPNLRPQPPPRVLPTSTSFRERNAGAGAPPPIPPRTAYNKRATATSPTTTTTTTQPRTSSPKKPTQPPTTNTPTTTTTSTNRNNPYNMSSSRGAGGGGYSWGDVNLMNPDKGGFGRQGGLRITPGGRDKLRPTSPRNTSGGT